MTKPRVLYIGSGNPLLGGAGYLVRQRMFLDGLSDVADVTAAMFDFKPGPTTTGVSFHALPTPQKIKPPRWRAAWEDYRSPLPRMLRGYDLAASRAAVAALGPETFDAVFSYRIDFAYFAGVLDRPRLLLDIDDPEHKRWRRRIEATGGRPDGRTEADLRKLEAFEKSAVAAAAVAFVCQPNDVPGWPKEPEVVPNCVEVLPDPVRRPVNDRVLFVGACAGDARSPNVDAVLFLLREIWPAVRRARPGAEFRLVGATGDVVCSAAKDMPGVTIVGFVDDLADEYATAAVAVAPIRFGTGTRVKILEAFAHGCPVVSTVQGAEGIPAVVGQEIEVGVGAEDFADRVIAVLQDPTTAARIGGGGHALARRSFDRAVERRKLAGRFASFLNV